MDDFDEVFQPQFVVEPTPGPLDLADEADWEDRVEFVSLEAAGLEERQWEIDASSGVMQYVHWANEGEDARDWSDQ
jgi:hypothetical protein